jgi:glycosyltransferase involved in cell wall biosynthesis
VKQLLVVSYYHPPFPGSGNRWDSMARHLRREGFGVTVVATDAFGRLADDTAARVVRARDLRSVGPLRRVLARGASDSAADPDQPPGALMSKVFVPDAQVASWLPFALPTVRRILSRASIDCLVTSSPPDSAHLIGLLLGRRRPAWVADFRDGWGFEPLRERFPTSPQRALDSSLERRVARAADITIGATRPIARDLAERLKARAACVTNGWDPEVEVDTRYRLGDPDGSVRLVYTGTWSGIRGSTPEPLLRALGLVRSEPGSARLRLTLAGRVTAHDADVIARSPAADAVENLGLLDRAEALSLQRSADALVLITSRNSSEATGKLFEYLTAGRPIIALAEGNEAERIVRETNTGVAVPPDDVEAIADALRRAASGELARAYTPRGLDQYTYPAPAERMAELIEEATRRRAEGRRLDTP